MNRATSPAEYGIARALPLTPVFWRQVRALTAANLKARYRKTVAGFVWVLLNPLIMYGVQSFVFRRILRLELPKYGLFLLSGLLPWIYVSQSLEMCTSIFVVSGRLLKSFPVHPWVYLTSQLADNAINFLAAFLLILVPTLFFEKVDPRGLVALPLAVALLFGGTFGVALLAATLHVFLRDTRFIISFMLSVAFFLTPVFYPASFIPEGYHWLIWVNPLGYLIEPFRACIYDFSFARFALVAIRGAAVAGALLAAGTWFWMKKRNAAYFNL